MRHSSIKKDTTLIKSMLKVFIQLSAIGSHLSGEWLTYVLYLSFSPSSSLLLLPTAITPQTYPNLPRSIEVPLLKETTTAAAAATSPVRQQTQRQPSQAGQGGSFSSSSSTPRATTLPTRRAGRYWDWAATTFECYYYYNILILLLYKMISNIYTHFFSVALKRN